MARFDYAQTSFSTGEIAPRARGRLDLEAYTAACAALENMIVLPQGGITARGGTKFIKEVKSSAQEQVLVPFTYTTEQEYILEFGHNYIRVFKDQANVESGGTPVEIVTTYTQAEVADLRFTQSDDTLYIAHKDHAPAKLTRTSHTAWTLSNITFTATPAEWIATNYPTIVWFFEQRLCWAATPDEPQTVWCSKSADYENLTTGAADDDAIIFTIYSDRGNAIKWASPGKVLAIGTAGAEFIVSSSTTSDPLTPTNISVRKYTSYGADFVDPIRLDSDVMFLQRGGRKLRRFKYKFERDTYVSEDLTLLSEHITESGIKKFAYVNEPNSIVWGVRVDGKLVGMTYEPESGVVGWHRHSIAGTDAKVISIAAINGYYENNDELWMVVERTINGSTKRYIEILTQGLAPEDDQEDSFFVDSGAIKTGSDFTTIDGLSHLEGETVVTLTDGFVQPGSAVSSGEIEVQTAIDQSITGLPFTPTVELLPLEGGNQIGTAQGRIKRVSTIHVRVYRTLGLRVSDQDYDEDVPESYEDHYFGPPTMGYAGDLLTEDIEMKVPSGYAKQGIIKLLQPYPMGFTILLVAYAARTADD